MQVILPCQYHCWWIQMNPPKIYGEILWYLPLQIRLWVHPKCSYCTYSYILVNKHCGSDIRHGVQWVTVDGKQHGSHYNQAKTLHHFSLKFRIIQCLVIHSPSLLQTESSVWNLQWLVLLSLMILIGTQINSSAPART